VKPVVTNPKYRKIIEIAHELFFKHGFRRVSIEEICKKADVSKMTFYRFFPNKLELAKTVFDDIIADGRKQFEAIIQDDSVPVQEKIKQLIILKSEGTKSVSKEFMEDFYLGNQPELQEFVNKRSAEQQIIITDLWKTAQQKGIFRKNFNPEFLIIASSKLMELFSDEKLKKMYPNPHDLIMELTNFMVYGIVQHSKEEHV